MARTAQIIRAQRSRIKPKFSTRVNRRCWKCGRGHGYLRDFDLCRICVRELASKGQLVGVRKASW